MTTPNAVTLKDLADAMIDEEGMTLTATARELGVSRTAVAKWRAEGPAPVCPDCGNPMRVAAVRCGLCAEERELDLNLVAA